MTSLHKYKGWRIGFIVFSLIYSAGVVYLALDNFDKVYGEYTWARDRQQPAQVSQIARQELVAQCRRKVQRELSYKERYQKNKNRASSVAEDTCLSWPQATLEKQEIAVSDRLGRATKTLQRKLVVFFCSFVFFFLFLPLILLYVIITFLVWLFRGVKFIR